MTTTDELLAARVAFENGDFATVRRLTDALAKSLDPEVRKQALALRARVGVDPIAVVVVLVCLGFFVAVCASYFGAR